MEGGEQQLSLETWRQNEQDSLLLDVGMREKEIKNGSRVASRKAVGSPNNMGMRI